MKKIFLLFFTGALALLSGCKFFGPCCDHNHEHEHHSHKTDQHHDSVTKIQTSEAFKKEVLQSTKPVIVDFSAPWCGACQVMKPIIADLAHELSDKYTFVEVNVDAASDIASTYNIQGIPTFTFFKDGKEAISENDRITGTIDKDKFKVAIEKNLPL